MATRSIPRFAKRLLASVAALLVALTALMGFAHTQSGRPLLAMMGRAMGGGGGKNGCPLGYDVAATPAQKRAARAQFAAAHQGEMAASGRPALGFVLDVTTRDDVAEWARAHGVACVAPRSGHDLDCSDVADSLLPVAFRGVGVRNLWLDFGANGELVAVIAVRRDESPSAIVATFEAINSDLANEAGAAAKVEGVASASRLAAAPLQQASSEYRFTNYYALARATNMGDGYLLTEEYRSLTN